MGGMLSAGSAVRPAAAAPAEPFCGVGGRVIPQWAYKTDFQQFLVDFHGFKTFVRTVGSPPKKNVLSILPGGGAPLLPTLVVHGGPGLSSTYLESLELLAADGRQIIFYDQIGCGKSFEGSGNRAPPGEEYSLGLFLSELDAVRSSLNLQGGFHLIGHGWGGMLALEAASRPGGCPGLASISLISTPPSTAALTADRRACVARLPQDDKEALLDGEPGTPRYEAALNEYRREFVNRQPRQCAETARSRTSKPVMQALVGPDWLSPGGQLAGWDATPALGGISVPTLVVRGEYDEVSQASSDKLIRGIKGARGLVCLDSGSYCHLDNPETALGELNDFMSAADESAASAA